MSIIIQSFLKYKILPIATMWMELEDIILSEISQRKAYNVSSNLKVESKKKNLKL